MLLSGKYILWLKSESNRSITFVFFFFFFFFFFYANPFYVLLDLSTVPLETTEPCARGKTSSLPNVFTANSPRWDENHNRGKDESNRKPR